LLVENTGSDAPESSSWQAASNETEQQQRPAVCTISNLVPQMPSLLCTTCTEQVGYLWFRALRVMRISLLAGELQAMRLSSSGALLSGAASSRLFQLITSVLTLLFTTSSIVRHPVLQQLLLMCMGHVMQPWCGYDHTHSDTCPCTSTARDSSLCLQSPGQYVSACMPLS